MPTQLLFAPVTVLIDIKELASRPTKAPPAFALWQLGFRPFFLLASGFAALSVGLWALQFTGWLSQSYLKGPLWHAHEMLFGFALAVVVGFLLTAGRNWSGRPTLTGKPLMALALLWVAGRVLVLTPLGWTAAVVNAAFPLAAAVALAIPLFASGSRRNYFFVGVLVLMSAALLGLHLNQLGVLPLSSWFGMQLALDALLFLMAVIGGRVIPQFTNNGVPDAKATRHAALEKAALGGVLLLLAVDVMRLNSTLLMTLAFVCAAAHLIRWIFWQPWKTTGVPLVWVLHVAYLWIPAHLVLRGFSELDWVTPSVAVHALTVGAAGGLIIGMMTRTARGHTGRLLLADRWDTACYLLIILAGLVRVLLPLVAPTHAVFAVLGSAMLWSGGFALYFLRYWPVLTRARIDGKPG